MLMCKNVGVSKVLVEIVIGLEIVTMFRVLFFLIVLFFLNNADV